MRRRKKKTEIRKKRLDLRFLRKRFCRFCKDKSESVSYRDIEVLTNFISERGRIIPGRISGNCAKHQRMVNQAIKRAREVAFLPFVSE